MAYTSVRPIILRSNRPLSSPRGDGSCFSNFFCPPPPSRAQAAREGPQKEKEAAAMQEYHVEVENKLYTIEESFFRDLQPSSPGTSTAGTSPESPLILHETSTREFEVLRDAHNAEKSGEPSSFQFPDLLIVGQLAKHYQITRLMTWFVIQFDAVVCPRHVKIHMWRDAPEPSQNRRVDVFMMASYLAVSYGRRRAMEFLTRRWISRLHDRTLQALPTASFIYGPGKDTEELTNVLAHACYVYLADLSVGAQKLGIPADELLQLDFEKISERRDLRLSLPRRVFDQIRIGNASLERTWERLCVNPPRLKQSSSCKTHARCRDVWERRWNVTALCTSYLPKMDVLRKLLVAFGALEADVNMKHGMNDECRRNAINSVMEARNRIACHLHHHFDLD